MTPQQIGRRTCDLWRFPASRLQARTLIYKLRVTSKGQQQSENTDYDCYLEGNRRT